MRITEEQRQRFVELYLVALDAVGMPDDEPFREPVHSHVSRDESSDAELQRCLGGRTSSAQRGPALAVERDNA